MAAYTMVNAHTAAEKRVVGIKNVVINLESATIKWCQITKLLREKQKKAEKICFLSVDSTIWLKQ